MADSDVPEKPSWSRVYLRASLAAVFGIFWTSLFWIKPLRSVEPWRSVVRGMDSLLRQLGPIDSNWRWVIKSYLFVAVAVGILWLFRRPPKALGMGRIADRGWRIVALGLLVSLPVDIWLGMRPGIHRYYAKMFEPGGWEPVLANALVIAVEHALIEGVILALALPKGWSFHELQRDPERTGRLAWLGFGYPPGERGFAAWTGIPAIVWPALVAQAIVFGTVHAGKEIGEFWTAWPGGLGLGLLTYRIRSVWPSVALHLGTGGIILLTAWLTMGR